MILYLSTWLLCVAPGFATADAEAQDKIQTAYIYQFTNYIDWPESALPPEGSPGPFVISVVGSSSLISKLEDLAKTKKVKNRTIEIHKAASTSQLKKSHIIILASSDVAVLQEVAQKAKGSSALVIGFAEGFSSKGAMINFFIEDSRLRFEINRSALEGEKLKASSQLLKLAKLVE